ncbi:MAG: TonB-dependent receptor [Acidobacteria bacterium]|nr:TonB-dependent receptor [Acidobacteriota bacterium]
MTKNFSTKFLAVAFSLLLSVVSVFAQSQGSTGSITGIVSDSTGAVVPNATVTLTSQGTNQTQTTTTSGDGIYKFVLLQPGKYSVKTTASSFADQTLDVEVQVGRTTDANFTLGASGVSAQVEVTAEGVQATTSNFDAVQNETAIQNLPINGRRFQDFVTLTPTAQVDPSRGQITLSGQRGINTNINVDGVDYNQPFFGGVRGGERSNSAFTIPQESIREFQVVAAGYSAEFGRSSGGIVNAVTKAGDNNLRGTLFYLLRPEQFAKANKFADALYEQRLSQITVNGVTGVDATLAPTQHQFGGSIGGPIVKDKLFFFGSYEQQRFRAPRQVLYGNLVGVVPTVSQTEAFNFYRSNEVPFQQTNDAYAALGRIDWNINDSNRLNVRYSYSNNNAKNAVSTGETALDPTTTNSLSTNGTEKNNNNIIVAQLVTNFAPTVVNEFKFQWAREERPRIPNAIAANINTAVGVYGTRNFLPTTQFDKRLQFVDSMTWISGNHTVKFGGEFSNIYASQEFGFNQTGVYTFSGLTSTTGILDAVGTTRTASFLGRFDTTTARYNQQIGNLQAAYSVRELAFFAQDSWRVSSKLTLNYGLRFEKQFNPSAEANNTPVIDLIKNTPLPLFGGKTIDPTQIPDSQNQWGPRVGFAYDPKGDGKTVIRGFAGVYYARTPLLVLAGPFNNFRNPAGDLSVTIGSTAFSSTGFNQAAFDAANPQYVAIVGGTGFAPNTVYRQFAILGINLNNIGLGALPTLTATQMSTIATAMRNATTNPPVNLGNFQNANFTGIMPDFKNPMSFQFGGGIERQIANGVTVGIDYSQVNTVFLQRNRDINLPNPTGIEPQTGRVLVNRNSRPMQSLGTVQLRDSSARSLYKALTFRINANRKMTEKINVRMNAFYTLSKSLSDDDNERDAGGVLYSNPYDLTGEYYLARNDRRHQFVANPIVFLPWGFEVASTVRLRSGTPVNSTVGTDVNGDGNNTERPILVPGFEIKRNQFRNRNIYDVDLRVQKGFSFGERRRLVLSTEFFNVFNFSNIQLTAFGSTNYCATSNARCGLDGITNPNFLQVREQRTTATVNGQPSFGKILVNNNPGSQVFQMQFGARLQF